MLIVVALLVLGLIVLGMGAELLVRGSSTIALKLGVTPLLIGLTVVAFGTSAPELAVSIEATLTNHSPLALGNVIGSNIANIGLILGLVAIIRPIQIDQQLVKKQIPIVIASSLFLWLLLLNGEVGFTDGVMLCAGLAGFLTYSYMESRKDAAAKKLIAENPRISPPARPQIFYLVMLIIGLVMLVYGSTLFVENAISLARILGINEVIIGLSIVAVGTSVPELATSLIAAYKNESELAVGNVVGSNLFNILGILGISALLGTIYGDEFNIIDFLVMLAYAVILLPFAWTSLRISRLEGFVLLAGYIAYMIYIFP